MMNASTRIRQHSDTAVPSVTFLTAPSYMMPVSSRTRWFAIAICGALPAVFFLNACSSDHNSTSPKATPTSDTVAIDQGQLTIIDHWVNPGEDSGYYSYLGADDGDYVEIDDGEGGYDDYRMLLEFPLPTLGGDGIVDSAKVYDYACGHSGTFTDSIVLDHVNWGAVYKDSASWGGQTLLANVGTLVRDTSSGWKSVSVTSSVQADYTAKRANSQFRAEWLYIGTPSASMWDEFAGSYCEDGGSSNSTAGAGYLAIWSH
jgi:hypothetical protein